MKSILKRLTGLNRIFILSAVASLFATSNAMAAMMPKQSDSASYVSIYGKIIDKETRKAVNYANIVLVGSSTGTIANAEGEFLLKVPKARVNEKVGISHLGYKTFVASVEQLKSSENIVLEPELVSLQEIIVRSEDPLTIIKGAYRNRSLNYRTTPVMLTAFYREAIQQNKKYVSIAEAVLETYKVSYDNYYADDRVKILIGRKSQDVKKMDTVVVKLQGGPVTPFYLDVVKNPENLFSDEYCHYYDYKLVGQISLDNARCYVIEFNQRPDVDKALYKGKVYIEVESLAIVGIEFGISEYGMEKANQLFVKKKPLTMRIDITGVQYFIKYTKSNGFWNLSYVRSELGFKCKWKKRFFSSTYKTMSEMAVTDIDTTNINKYKQKETTHIGDIFSEQAAAFKNDEFWGEYNIIKPEESIQSAIEKLNKKLKKK